MKKIFSIILALAVATSTVSVCAQYATADVELESEQGSEITVVSYCSAKKGGEAKDEAIEGAFYTLLVSGVPGLHNGKPMLEGNNDEFLRKFFGQELYNRYLSGNPEKISERKVNGIRQVTVRLGIRVQGLVNAIKNGGGILSPAWTDGKKDIKVTAAVNPTIIVVPYVKGDGDDGFATMKAIMDSSPAASGAVDAVMSLFSSNGFKTRDLRTALKNIKTGDALDDGEVQEDSRTNVARMLPADIVVSVDVNISGNDKANGCNLTLRAVENQTENVLTNVNFSSGMYMTKDSALLVNYAVKNIKKDFMNGIRKAFDDIVENGRSMNIELKLGNTVTDWDFSLESPQTGDDFMEAFEEWLADNSYKGVYDMGTNTDKFIGATINIPIWDNNRNRGYSTSNFSRDLKKFLKKELGDSYQPEITSLRQKISVIIK